jgi:hypothetical protein
MDGVTIGLAIYLALWIGLYKNDIKRDLGLDKPKVEQTEIKDGNTTDTQK